MMMRYTLVRDKKNHISALLLRVHDILKPDRHHYVSAEVRGTYAKARQALRACCSFKVIGWLLIARLRLKIYVIDDEEV